jgi:DNA-binding CsgD family transcriptional regulator
LLGLRFATGPGGEIAIGLCRKTAEFTDRETELMSLLRPHLTQAFERVESVRHARDQLAMLEASPDAAHCAIIVVGRDGTVRLATQKARSLLSEFFEQAPSRRLPEPVQAWLRRFLPDTVGEPPPPHPQPLLVAARDRELSLRMVGRADDAVLVLHERWTRIPPEALAQLSLTPREAQVLASVAMGRTDLEIAQLLGISFRTVKKHVEHILAKLGADNRTVATARAHGAVDAFRN